MIYRAGLILPVEGAAIPDGGVRTSGERIADVCPFSELRKAYPGEPVTDFTENAVIIPGLVNLHTHLELEDFASLAKPSSFVSWLAKLVLKGRKLERGDWLDSARRGAMRQVAGGVTTVADISRWAAGVVAMAETNLRGVAYHEMVAVDDSNFGPALEDLLERMGIGRYGWDRRAGISPHAAYSLSSTTIKKLVRLAESMGSPVAIHVSETIEEVRMVEKGEGKLARMFRPLVNTGLSPKGSGRSPVAYLDSLGALGRSTLAVHCTNVTADDIEVLADRGVRAVLCPTSNSLLKVGVPPVADLLKAGVKIGVGTDGAASNPRLDLFEELRRVRELALEQSDGSLDIPHDVLLSTATLEAAEALGLKDEIGSLVPGKSADLVALKVPTDAHVAPITTWARREDVVATVIAGRIVHATSDFRCDRKHSS